MKQTAVEWLIEQIFNEIDLKDSILKLAIKQAKEMEKKQIIDAWDNGCEDDGIIDNAQQYYDETFKPKQR